MAFRLLFLILLFSCSFSFARIISRFPSSITRPEQYFSFSTGNNNKLYETKYFTQLLDHFTFTPESYQTFQQRYLINHKYWGGSKKNSPIFVYTGNEGDIEWFAQNTGFMFDTAPHFEALLVFIEHRFYGKSIPFGGNKEVAYANSSTLGYLTSTLALADYATLIIDLKKNLTAEDSPVVVFGGSYGGSMAMAVFFKRISIPAKGKKRNISLWTFLKFDNYYDSKTFVAFAVLAAWFRLKYPHVAIGALASSAPILNFENITSPYSFNNIITQDFRSESENCYQVIKKSWQQIEDTAKESGGLELLRNSFRVCKNYINADALEGWLGTAYTYSAMTDYPTPSNFLNPLPAYPVKQMCKEIDDPKKGNNTFEKLYAAANVYYNYTGKVKCFNLMEHPDPHGLAEWTWQACTEMILPTDGNNAESIFPALEWNYTQGAQYPYCENNYGVQPRPNWITSEFGGHDIRRSLKRFGSNIIFFNGLRDPWSGGGVLKSISKSLVAITAKHGAHHVDLRFETNEDPEWLRQVRKKEIKIIQKWISQYYSSFYL